jgi:hypothetical protein
MFKTAALILRDGRVFLSESPLAYLIDSEAASCGLRSCLGEAECQQYCLFFHSWTLDFQQEAR